MSTLLRGRYPTTLTIGPSTLDGRDIVLIEIESNRDALPGLGDKTHARIALQEVQRFCDKTVIYRIVSMLINEPAAKSLEYSETGPPASAICTVHDGDTLLQIQYMENFHDAFRFSDIEVQKSGMFFGADGGVIQWWEELEQPRR